MDSFLFTNFSLCVLTFFKVQQPMLLSGDEFASDEFIAYIILICAYVHFELIACLPNNVPGGMDT